MGWYIAIAILKKCRDIDFEIFSDVRSASFKKPPSLLHELFVETKRALALLHKVFTGLLTSIILFTQYLGGKVSVKHIVVEVFYSHF